MTKIIAYDLGTGGIKASLFNEAGISEKSVFIQYQTYYPCDKFHEQRPQDWWQSVCSATRQLLESTSSKPGDIAALGLSGHSLVAAPLSASGELLLDQIPIWSDTRASGMLPAFFGAVPYEEWYMATGNGFPAECYSIFKLMWLRQNMPDVYKKTATVIGSKDYINYMLTGELCTDKSYASGTGAFDLAQGVFREDFLRAAGLSPSIMPEIVPSAGVVGKVTAKAAKETGLLEGTKVVCGGVDNSCMAFGARGEGEGRVYTSLGSSSWIALTSQKPILDAKTRPYVFAHVADGYYTSALSIFSGGNSFRWVRDEICRDIASDEQAYRLMDEAAAKSPVGANGLLFNPSLAGGTSQDKSINIRGAFIGLGLGHTREDLIRAAMEGIALNLRIALDGLRKYAKLEGSMLLCGGGSKSKFWRQVFADAYGLTIIKTSVDQDAASLGAAALAARGVGLWSDYANIDKAHKLQDTSNPNPEAASKYDAMLDMFQYVSGVLSDIGDRMQSLKSL